MLAAYLFEIFFILVLYISRLTGLCTKGTSGDATDNCQCLATKANDCGDHECKCSAVVIHTEDCIKTSHERNRSMREHRDGFHGRARSAFQRHNHAMMEAIPSFLDTAIFFSISIGIGMTATNDSQGFTQYEKRIFGYVAPLATLPQYAVITLSDIAQLPRRDLRLWLASLATLLACGSASAMLGSYFGSKPWYELGSKTDRWGLICFGYGVKFKSAKTSATGFTIVFAAFMSSWPIFIFSRKVASSWFPERLEKPPVELGKLLSMRGKKIAAWAAATSILALTFFEGACLIYDRQHMKALAGRKYNESDMSYGQYLAAFIWLPVVVEYLYHIKYK